MKAPLKTTQEVQALYAHAETMREPSKYALLIALTYRLGLRPIEIAQLDTRHFSGGELRIQIGHTKGKRSGRSLPVPSEVMERLAAYMQERTGRVFLNRDGEFMDKQAVSKCLARLYREAGQRGSCYSGRRTLLTQLVERDVNILTVQAIAGHKSPLTTISYVGVTKQMMERALAA